MPSSHKPLAWLHGEIKTPPFGLAGRWQADDLLRRLQRGETITLPHSRPMSSIGANCQELRITDANRSWRIVYCVNPLAIVILEVFAKTTPQTPKQSSLCKQRLALYLTSTR